MILRLLAFTAFITSCLSIDARNPGFTNTVDSGFSLNAKGQMTLLDNTVDNKIIHLNTSSNIEISRNFSAKVNPGKGKVTITSDLNGLEEW